ncbi:histidine kinase dimerization/phosphoacceptor domain -containing protein [Falsirhodobacter sp. alg1]|uniref:histidine kinase dimerization/phosphoacceptor domain -containing protein n=1 Tax=Falsirhodobacter sp. alg1 TaxID=1472418 RepID=UPI0005F07AA4|nr:histidine kinase dimerization/phosphoacceptor domain -containing protein [Falsirhodobacter sp. alg1]
MRRVLRWLAPVFSTQRSPLFRWSFAVISLVLAIVLRWVVAGYLPAGFPFLTFFPAIILTTFLGGFRPGLFVCVGSFFASWLLFVSEPGTVNFSAEAMVAMAFFAFVAATDLILITLTLRVTQQLEKERRISSVLAEQRGLMFHELQHRVSNNLATVAGLLTIQRRAVKDEVARKALDDAAARINVVARMKRILHDPLAQEVSFGDVLQDMARDMIEASGATDRITMRFDCAPVAIPRDQAIPFGLIATELLTNAVEHGFAGDGTGVIDVRLSQDAGYVTLTIADQGRGLPEGFSLDKATSLGLTLASQFAIQLNGELTMKNRPEGGAVSRLAFMPA